MDEQYSFVRGTHNASASAILLSKLETCTALLMLIIS